MKKTIISALVALICAQAYAADYYVVTPVKGKTESRAGIQVTLNQTTLPTALVGTPYSYDFRQALQVTGDANYNSAGVAWALVSGALPAGLSLDAATGVLSGIPSAGGASSFGLTATYKTKQGTQTYSLSVSALALPRWGTSTLSFGNVGLYGDETVTATLYNDGATTGHWTSMSNLGSGVTADASGCANVVGGGSCTVTFHFTPSALGALNLSGIVPAGATNSANTLTLTGAGVQRVLAVSPAVSGKTSWNVDVDGPLPLSAAGSWTLTPATSMGLNVKLWGAGGGGGGYDGSASYAGKGGGGAFVGGLYQVAKNTVVSAVVGGGGGLGLTSVTGTGAGAAGSNGGGTGGNAGTYGTSGGGGGGGGRTELMVGATLVACAGGGGGGGGDGNTASNTNNNGNYFTGYTASKVGGNAVNRSGDGGGNGGGGGGCNGGAASTNYPFSDSNGEGGSAGGSSAPLLKTTTITAAGTDGLPANSADSDLGASNARGGNASASGVAATAGAAGNLVIR